MIYFDSTVVFNLQRHADGSGSSGGGEAGGATGSNSAIAGQSASVDGQNTPIAPEKTSFDDLLKDPDYKKAYDDKVSKAIQSRFKTANAAEERLRNANPLFERLASKYGVQAGDDGNYDLEELLKATDADDSYYENEAMERGISVTELKRIKTLERENAEFKRRSQEAEKQANQQRIYQNLMSGAEQCKKMYPSFDLDTEMRNETFARMVMVANVPVQTAFEVVHKDQIMPAAMQYAANKTAENTARTIAAGRSRPSENGASGSSAADTNLNPANLNKQQIQDFIARSKRGEKISF